MRSAEIAALAHRLRRNPPFGVIRGLADLAQCVLIVPCGCAVPIPHCVLRIHGKGKVVWPPLGKTHAKVHGLEFGQRLGFGGWHQPGDAIDSFAKCRNDVTDDDLHARLLTRREISFGVHLPDHAAHRLLGCFQGALRARRGVHHEGKLARQHLGVETD